MIGRNVEIKARVNDFDRVQSLVAKIADSGPIDILQEDTFFNCRKGRLKIRKFSDSDGELIYYDRENSSEPTECTYTIVKISEPDAVSKVLGESLGVRGVVQKRRTLFTTGQTRIHLDDVEGLGKFIELEVVLSPEQSMSEGRSITISLMEKLGISEADLIDCAYIDMIDGA